MSWAKMELASLAKPRLGGNYRNETTPTSRPLIKMGNLMRVNINVEKMEYIPESEKVDERHRLRYGDVLFNTRNTLDLVGKVAIWQDELPRAYYNSNILRFEFDGEYVGDSRFFGYALNSKSAIESIRALATGTTSVAAVYTRDLMQLEVPVPSKDEQIRISDILADADSSVRSLERLISKKQSIKQGMMQELLTGRTRLPGFIKDWTRSTAGELGVFKGGIGFPVWAQGGKSGAYPFFKVSDMNLPGNETVMKTSNNWVSENIRRRLAATVLPAGAIVFAKVGAAVYLERKRILGIPSCVDNNMAAFIPDSTQIDNRFAYYYLLSFPLSSLVAMGALPSLNSSQLRSIPFHFPEDIEEQKAIAQILQDADQEIATLERRLESARNIKQGMMQELLTGRTRLPVEEVSS